MTALLHQGGNAVGVWLGNGWYSQDQYVYPSHSEPLYGPPRLLFSLVCLYSNGTNVTFSSNASTWACRQGPITQNSVYHGEDYDSRLESEGWSTYNYSDRDVKWLPVDSLPAPGPLRLQMMEPVGIEMCISPVSISSTLLNVAVFDFGMNTAGVLRITTTGPVGSTIIARHAEVLQPIYDNTVFTDDMIYVNNLRAAAQTDRWILNGKPNQVLMPRFTVHG